MTTFVYSWPDDLCIMREKWVHVQNTNSAKSLLTGKVYRSVFGRERIAAQLTIDGALSSANGRASNKMSAIRRALQGGRHFVSLDYTPFGLFDAVSASKVPFDGRFLIPDLPWADDTGADRAWSDAGSSRLWAGGIKAGAPVRHIMAGASVIDLDHHKPNTFIAGAGTYVQIGNEVVQLLSDMSADATGLVHAEFYPALKATFTGTFVTVNWHISGIFDVTEFPDVTRDWTKTSAAEPWQWGFSQVFADEIGTYEGKSLW